MKRAFLTLLLLGMMACSGGGSDTAGLPSVSVPEVSANQGLFDVWTLTAKVTSSDCPDIAVGQSVSSEIRLASRDKGCEVTDRLADGTFLTDSDQLFDAEETVCAVGGDVVTLDWQPIPNDEGDCHFNLVATGRLTLSNDALTGNYGGNLKVSGTCTDSEGQKVGPLSCRALASVTAVRGRQIAVDPTTLGMTSQAAIPSKGFWR